MCWQPAVFLYHIRRQGSNIPVQPGIKTAGACRPVLSLLGQLWCFAEQNPVPSNSPQPPNHAHRVGQGQEARWLEMPCTWGAGRV